MRKAILVGVFASILCLANVSAVFALPDLVFILSGQSNMNGMALSSALTEEEARIPNNVEYWNQGIQVFAFNENETFGPEVGFAHAISSKYPTRHIVIIKCAVGSTSIYAWRPDWTYERARITKDANKGPLYQLMISQVKSILSGRSFEYCGFLWMQGEKDTAYEQSSSEYGECLELLFSALKTDLDPSIKFFCGISEPSARRPYYYNVIKAQLEFTRYARVYGVQSYGCHRIPASRHYDATGELELGQRFAERVIRFFDE